MRLLPAYMAVGIPIEGYLMLKTVGAVSDIAKTVLNVTGDMTVATILSRFLGNQEVSPQTLAAESSDQGRSDEVSS